MVQYIGVITAVEKAKNYGFVATDAFAQADLSPHGLTLGVNAQGRPKALFVHRSVLPAFGDLRVGTKISFEVEMTEKGYQAKKGTVTVLQLGPETSKTPKAAKPAPKLKQDSDKPKPAATAVDPAVKVGTGLFAKLKGAFAG